MNNRDKLEHILEYAKQQRHIGQSCKVPPEDMVEIMERLLNAGNSPVIGIDPASGPDRTVEVRYVSPPGYVMVPKEPTPEMLAVINEAIKSMRGSAATYARVLAAAPQELK